MNIRPPNIEFQLKPTVEIGKISALRAMERNMEPMRTYRLHYPPGVSGELMTLKTGELEGLKTTSVMGSDGIIAVAGLEPIDVTPTVALNVLNLWQFGMLAEHINDLAGKIAQIQSYIYQQSKAELDNIFVSLRDIARRVPECLENSTYKTYLFTQLAAVKNDAGQYFQRQLLAFGGYVTAECEQMSQRDTGILVSNPIHLKSQSVFKPLELLAVVELFEIVIDGRFTSSMLSAAKDHIKDRSDQILADVSRYWRKMRSSLESRHEQDRQQYLTYYQHQSKEENWIDISRRIDECWKKITEVLYPLNKVLIPELDEKSVRVLCVSSMDGLLRISKGF